MKNLKLFLIIIISMQIYVSCSTNEIISNNKSSDIDNRILFYGLNRMIYISDESFSLIDTVANGVYPVWLDSKTKIGFHSPNNFYYYIIDAVTKDTLNSYDLTSYGTFVRGRYSEVLSKFIFDVNHHGFESLGIMDSEGSIQIMSLDYPIYNPVSSGTDDWIYYLKNADSTFNVCRMKLNGAVEEQITNSSEYGYGNFSVSFDGEYIVVPKKNSEHHFIVIIDTKNFKETLIDLSSLNLVAYTSLSKDNKFIYFTGDENRNLYKINFDGTGLEQLTDTGYLYRPLTW